MPVTIDDSIYEFLKLSSELSGQGSREGADEVGNRFGLNHRELVEFMQDVASIENRTQTMTNALHALVEGRSHEKSMEAKQQVLLNLLSSMDRFKLAQGNERLLYFGVYCLKMGFAFGFHHANRTLQELHDTVNPDAT